MKNKILSLFLFFGIAPIFISCGAGGKDEQPKIPPPTPVTAEPVQKQKTTYYDEYPATVTALNQVDLRAQVTGYITGIFFKDGQHVNAGQKMYDNDRSQYEAYLYQA